jgi:WD40 repeat protein
VISTLQGHSNSIISVTFSPDGKYLASGSLDNTIRLWNFEQKKEVTMLQGHTDNVYCVAFSPDGKYLASGGCDKTIKLWRVQ